MNPIGATWPAGLAAAMALAAGAPQQAGQQPPTFRAATELVVIDAHVVGRDGAPITGLTADRFEVFIDGRRRPVVSAELVAMTGGAGAADAGQPAAMPAGEAVAPPSRVIVLAIDQGSFPVVAQQSAREAARRVLDRAAPDDHVGLVAFPGTLQVSPTRDRGLVRKAIAQITGARVDVSHSRFRISASEALQLRSFASVSAKEIVARECPAFPPDPVCPPELMQDAGRIADGLEQQGMLTIDGLHGVLDAMTPIGGRKTLIVISAGLPMWNQPGSRLNLNSETERISRRAAAANVNLYVFYMNVHFLRAFSAEYGRRNYALYEDISMFGSGLERFADAGGGAFFQIEVDSDPFVERALRETSAAYLIAVRAEPSERDGKEHFVRVNVRQRGATVRYRRVVVIPDR